MSKSQPLVGSRAPSFSLVATQGPGSERIAVTLDKFQDRWLILLFYPRDFTLICPTELTAISKRMDEFRRRDCDVIGISTDPLETHEHWIALPLSQSGLGGLKFPLASDESGAVCQAFGVYVSRQNVALRGLFIIDPNGVLQYQAINNLSIGRSSDEVLRVLDALQSGGLCPSDWNASQPVMNVAQVAAPNTLLGQYRVAEVIGSGSFGTVLRADDTLLHRAVALKIIRNEPGAPKDALLTEARSAAALNHPNICIIYAVDTDAGFPMIVMEHIDGEPLSKKLERGPLPLAEARSIARQIALGMAAAHERNIIHGDLKPGNVMITPASLVKIMDFGLARRYRPPAEIDATLQQSDVRGSSLSGTPAYMSPEQSRGEPLTPASDVFSLGLVYFEMTTGKREIETDNLLDTLRRIDKLDAEPYAMQTPEPFASMLRQMLVRDVGQRRITMVRVAEIVG